MLAEVVDIRAMDNGGISASMTVSSEDFPVSAKGGIKNIFVFLSQKYFQFMFRVVSQIFDFWKLWYNSYHQDHEFDQNCEIDSK